MPADAKRHLLEHLVRSGNLTQVLCFMRTKHGASRLARQLAKDGFTSESIHGDKSQQARMEALEAFKEGKLQVLVATDVAARGLDIDSLPHVLNYELPHVPEDYIHRIGRTGRAGASGEALSFVAPEEEKYLADIERLLKKTVPIVVADGFDMTTLRAERPVRGARSQGEPAASPARAERHRQPHEQPSENAPLHSTEPASAPASERKSARAPRAPRETNSRGAASNAAHARPNGGERPNGDWRREERERAYALNPDQPLSASLSDASPRNSGASADRPPLRKMRPIPALLMKRPAKEPEKV